MTLEELQTEWAKDSVYEEHELGDGLRGISKLHSKYYGEYVAAKAQHFKAEKEYNAVYSVLYRYYAGIGLEEEEQTKFGFDFAKSPLIIAAKNIDQVISADARMVPLVTKLAMAKLKVDTTKDYVTHLKDRIYALTKAVDYVKFVSGG